MTDFKPGTVAVATVRGVKGRRVLRVRENPFLWRSLEGVEDFMLHRDRDVTDIRPLVVLDPEDYEQIRGLVQFSSYLTPGAMVRPLTEALQRGLRSLVKPPRIPEPGKYGVVRATGQGLNGVEWVNEGRSWVSIDGEYTVHPRWAEWHDLIDPVLVREGL